MRVLVEVLVRILMGMAGPPWRFSRSLWSVRLAGIVVVSLFAWVTVSVMVCLPVSVELTA